MSRAQPILRQGEVVRGETERWKVLQKIGEGQFSEVYQVLELSTQQQVSGRRHHRLPPALLPSRQTNHEASVAVAQTRGWCWCHCWAAALWVCTRFGAPLHPAACPEN